MKKIISLILGFIISFTAFAADPCSNFDGTWKGTFTWKNYPNPGHDTTTNITVQTNYSAGDGAVVFTSTEEGSRSPDASLIGLCLNGTLLMRNYNSVYLGVITGNSIKLEGQLIPAGAPEQLLLNVNKVMDNTK